MVRRISGLMVITALVPLLANARTYSQTAEPPRAAAPAPSGPALEGSVTPPRLVTPPVGVGGPAGPLSVPPPSVSSIAPYQDNNGPGLGGDPLLDPESSPPPGWFAALDVDFLGPHIKNRLIAPVTVAGFAPNAVHLPTAGLDWVSSPRFELGYRWPEGVGEIVLSYRFLVSEGTDSAFGFFSSGDAFLKSRLNVNVVDLDYGSREFSLAPHWDMKWKAGARLTTAYFDSRADSLFFEQRTSNNFIGAGPHVGLDLWRTFDLVPEFGFFGRLEGASVIGEISQAFEEVADLGDSRRGTPFGGATTIHHIQAVPVLSVQVGLSWMPTWNAHWRRFALGYEFERWWYLGEAADSRGELTTHGVFFRGELAF